MGLELIPAACVFFFNFFQIATKNNWKLISDPAEIANLCTEVIKNNPKLVEQYQKGKTKLLFALAGDIAKQTDNRINMEMVVDALKKMLKK
jgi:aspartyl-tRNA(Asn)/glutamyl-tRNA(Gln) amidotransferase subunit B